MIVRTPTEWPMILALTVLDRQIIDAGDTPAHQTFRVELPILVSVAAEPMARIVVPFVCEAHGDPIIPKGPYFLEQSIIELTIPFACEKRLDFFAAVNEFGAVV